MKIFKVLKLMYQWQLISVSKQLLQLTIVLIQNKKMLVMFYVLIVAFHPELNLRKIFIQKSYGHSLQQLTTIDYLTNNQILLVKCLQLKLPFNKTGLIKR